MGTIWKIGEAARPSFRVNRTIQRRSFGCYQPYEADAKRRLGCPFRGDGCRSQYQPHSPLHKGEAARTPARGQATAFVAQYLPKALPKFSHSPAYGCIPLRPAAPPPGRLSSTAIAGYSITSLFTTTSCGSKDVAHPAMMMLVCYSRIPCVYWTIREDAPICPNICPSTWRNAVL
jgi:hypothetical protein